MSIDPNTLPAGTVVEVAMGESETVVYIRLGGYAYETDEAAPLHRWCEREPITRVFVPVPDGVTYDDALRAVEDARPWVPMKWSDVPEGARWRNGGVKGDGARLFEVHPDDVPDPDADLIERIAAGIAEADGEKVEDWGDIYHDRARAALAVIREDQS